MKRLASTLCADDLGKRLQVLDDAGDVMFAGTLDTLNVTKPFSDRMPQQVMVSVASGTWRTTQHVAAAAVVVVTEVEL